MGRQTKLLNPNWRSSSIVPTGAPGSLGQGSDTSMLTNKPTSTVSNTPAAPGPNTPIYSTTRGRTLAKEKADLMHYQSQMQARQRAWAKDPSRAAALKRYGAEAPGIADRLAKIAQEEQRLAGLNAGTPSPDQPKDPAEDDGFKTIEDFLSKDVMADPAAQNQMKLGTEALDSYLQAKGLGGGGAQIKAAERLAAQVGADQTNRQLQAAGLNAQMFQNYAQNLIDNKRNLNNDQFDKLYKTIELMANQSPMGNAYGASKAKSDIYSGLGQGIASLIASLGGGGGGGGGKTPVQIPPYSTTGVDSKYAGQGSANNIDWASLFANLGGKLAANSKS